MTLGSKRLAYLTARETPELGSAQAPALPDDQHGHPVTSKTECVPSKPARNLSVKQITGISQPPREQTL